MSASVPPFTMRQDCSRAKFVSDAGPTRRTALKGAAGIGALVATAIVLATEQPSAQTQRASSPASELRPVTSFAGITDQRARSIALFGEMSKVLRHPRCMNCHPAGDRPTQTDVMRPHQPLVVRGTDGQRNVPSCSQLRSRWHPWPSGLAFGAGVDGMAGPLASANLRPDQRSQPQRQPRSRGADPALVRGQLGRLGLVAGREAHARTRDAGAVWRARESLGANRRTLTARLNAAVAFGNANALGALPSSLC